MLRVHGGGGTRSPRYRDRLRRQSGAARDVMRSGRRTILRVAGTKGKRRPLASSTRQQEAADGSIRHRAKTSEDAYGAIMGHGAIRPPRRYHRRRSFGAPPGVRVVVEGVRLHEVALGPPERQDSCGEPLLTWLGSRLVFLIDWNRARKRSRGNITRSRAACATAC